MQIKPGSRIRRKQRLMLLLTSEFPERGISGANAITEQMNEELGSLGQALVTAIFLIFIAMAIQFESPKYS